MLDLFKTAIQYNFIIVHTNSLPRIAHRPYAGPAPWGMVGSLRGRRAAGGGPLGGRGASEDATGPSEEAALVGKVALVSADATLCLGSAAVIRRQTFAAALFAA